MNIRISSTDWVLCIHSGAHCRLSFILGSAFYYWDRLHLLLVNHYKSNWRSTFRFQMEKNLYFVLGCLSCASYTVYPILTSLGFCLDADKEDLLIKITAILYGRDGANKYWSFSISKLFFSYEIRYIGLITALNCYSVDWTIRVQNVFTVAKLVAIVVLIGCGIYQLSTGEFVNFLLKLTPNI